MDPCWRCRRAEPQWIIDTGVELTEEAFALYESLYDHVRKHVKPDRDNNKREHRRTDWRLHAETCSGMRIALKACTRFIATPRVSKHRIFAWMDDVVLGDDGIYVFARSDDYFFGLLHSRAHEVWARSQGTQVRERESGFRYTPTTCFETFPFPHPTRAQEGAIAAAAKELDALRNNWLNPPKWTKTETLEFPGSIGGSWHRFIDPASVGRRHPHPGLLPEAGEREKEGSARCVIRASSPRMQAVPRS